ncbi:MAG: hypothetical protein AAGB30_11075 [Pedobacter sp.]
MSEVIKKYRLPLKLQLISWFLLNEHIGPHVTSYMRLLDIKDDEIILNTYELSIFYQNKFIDDKVNIWADGLAQFLEPKLSRFVYDLADMTQFFTLQVAHKGIITKKTIRLRSEL